MAGGDPGGSVWRVCCQWILPWHIAGAGRLDADHPLPAVDVLLAATAMTHKLILITRNTVDFTGIATLQLLNPWLN